MREIGEIVVDDDVPMRRVGETRKRKLRNPTLVKVVDKFAAMRPGQSFFVPGVTKKQMDFIRKPLNAEGLGHTMREVDCDEIYQQPGVRVWRLHGEYDQL